MRNELEDGKYYWASFNRFEMAMPTRAIKDLSASGSVDDAAKYWADKVVFNFQASDDPEAIIIFRATEKSIRQELREYGAWDGEELEDEAMNIQRLIWIAACNIAEEDELSEYHKN